MSEFDQLGEALRKRLHTHVEDVQPTGGMALHLGRLHWLDALSRPLDAHIHWLIDSARSILAGTSPAAAAVTKKTAVRWSPPERWSPCPASDAAGSDGRGNGRLFGRRCARCVRHSRRSISCPRR